MKQPRVKRSSGPSQTLTDSNYRDIALPHLLSDFGNRCAYSMQHVNDAGGETCMEIDHHDPTLRGKKRHQYTNLFPATRHCNGSKLDHWPTRAERRKGLRFLDCTRETDYGAHLFEDPTTHRIVAVTTAGRYHTRMCALNAEHLVEKRRQRSELAHELGKVGHVTAHSTLPFPSLKRLFDRVEYLLAKAIPPIPSPPQSHSVPDRS